jgi:hypothetical protein
MLGPGKGRGGMARRLMPLLTLISSCFALIAIILMYVIVGVDTSRMIAHVAYITGSHVWRERKHANANKYRNVGGVHDVEHREWQSFRDTNTALRLLNVCPST